MDVKYTVQDIMDLRRVARNYVATGDHTRKSSIACDPMAVESVVQTYVSAGLKAGDLVEFEKGLWGWRWAHRENNEFDATGTFGRVKARDYD